MIGWKVNNQCNCYILESYPFESFALKQTLCICSAWSAVGVHLSSSSMDFLVFDSGTGVTVISLGFWVALNSEIL